MDRNVQRSRMLPRLFWYTALAILIISLLGCSRKGSQQETADTGKLKVVTTLFPYYDFTRQIAGDTVDLTMIIPAGMDSHSFEPTPADLRKLQQADLLICNGGAMEVWVQEVLEAIDAPKLQVITMMDYVDAVAEEIVEGMEDEEHDHHSHHDHTGHAHGEGEPCEEEEHAHQMDEDGHREEIEYDEHIWTSPANAVIFAQEIQRVLIEMDPANAPVYQQGGNAYLAALQELDERMHRELDNRSRNMIIIGDKFPFRYLAEEFELDYRAAFSGCSTDTEPSAKTIAYLIDKVRDTGMPVIYYLELSSHRVAEVISEETGAALCLLHSCHNVTRPEFDRGITYLELMEQNLVTLRKGLVE